MPSSILRLRAASKVITYRLLSLLVLLTLFAPVLTPQRVAAAPSVRIVYVKPDAPDTNSGTSWATARSLLGALTDSVAGDEIWVAAGVHYPRSPFFPLFVSFRLKSGVAVYGGFAGNETSREQRNPATQVTVLSGDLGEDDIGKSATGVVTDTANIVGENSYHVVNGNDTDNTAILDGFTITAGSATADEPEPCNYACGGGLIMVNGNAELSNLIFSGNRAGRDGGGMYLDTSSPALINVIFSSNNASDGGGIYNTGGSAPSLTNVTFSDNGADNGSGMYNSGSSPILEFVTFSDNNAYSGGGMYNANSSPILTDVTFDNNRAAYGGGMYLENNSNANLTDVDFSGNTASFGGGIYNDSSSAILTNVVFSGGQATLHGGGMYNYFSRPILMYVTFSGNNAEVGGGMYNIGSNPTLTNVTFRGNRVPQATTGNTGGGMNNTNNSNPILTNVDFSGNQATGGGGIYNDSSSAILTNVTFSGNQAIEGSGVSNNNSSPVFQNSIVWNNTPNSIINRQDSNPTFSYSLVQGLTPGTTNLNGMDSGNNPLFVRPATCGSDGCGDDPETADNESANDDYGDLRLQVGSPATDIGNNNSDLDAGGSGTATISSVATDLLGQPRIVAVNKLPAIIDLGAHERVTTPTADAGGPYSINEGSSLALDGTASNDADGTIVSYAWDCTGDGSMDITALVATGSVCTYPDNGSYTLRLTITDNVSATHTTTTTVTVANVAPTYTPAADQSTLATSAKQFGLGNFTDPGAEGSWSVSIDWGDNSALTEFAVGATGNFPDKSHTYATAGTYNVRVTVNDGENSEDGGFQVVVNPLPAGAPNVTAPADQSATVGSEQTFGLGSFVDPSSSGPWQVSVNWGDGSTATQFSVASSGQLPARPHTFAAANIYDVVVTVSDSVLSASASFRVAASSELDNAGSVAGSVFVDTNNNGTQEADEVGVQGAELALESAEHLSLSSIALTRTTASDANGRYRLDNLPPGNYSLTLTPPPNYTTLNPFQMTVAVASGETTNAVPFTLQPDEAGSSDTIFLPAVERP